MSSPWGLTSDQSRPPARPQPRIEELSQRTLDERAAAPSRHRRARPPQPAQRPRQVSARRQEYRPNLTGFSETSNRRLAYVVVLFVAALIGWAIAGPPGVGVALAVAVVFVIVPWRGQPLWVWILLRIKLWRAKTITFSDPITVASNRSGGGVRIEDKSERCDEDESERRDRRGAAAG